MPNFGSFFRRKAPNQTFNTANLNAKVRGLVTGLRQLKGSLPTNFQTNNAFMNGTKAERNALNKSIVNFIRKYNKGVLQTAVAAATPTPTTVAQASTATQQAVNAAQRVQRKVNQVNTNATRAQDLMNEAATPAVPELSNKNNKRNLLKTLTNANLANNTKINATIKKIRGMNPNANWANVNANGFTNAQKKVLNGLKQGENYKGLVRQQTPNVNGNLGTANLFKQALTPPPPPPPPPPRVSIIRQGGRVSKLPTGNNVETARKGINFNELKRRVAQRQARVAAAAPKN